MSSVFHIATLAGRTNPLPSELHVLASCRYPITVRQTSTIQSASRSARCNRQRFRKALSALEYAADLTPVVAAKEASASWNTRGMAETA
jgi:hypothetical protein